MRKRLYFASAAALLTACTHPDDSGSQAAAGGNVAVTAGTPRLPGNEGLAATGNAYVTQLLTVRREPTDAKEVDDPTAKKKKSINWVAMVYRGEQVTIIETKGDWSRIRLSDGKEGWSKGDALLTGGGVEMATVFDKVKTFTRPDLLALNTSRQLEPGTLLFVLRGKDQFSEVNAGGTNTIWVLSDVLGKDSREVEAAKLINRGRTLKDRNDPGSEAPLELARSQFGGTRLVQTLLMPAVDPNAPQDANGAVANPNAAPPAPDAPAAAPAAAPAPGMGN